MKIVGIDLGVKPRDTAVCEATLDRGTFRIDHIDVGSGDQDYLQRRIHDATWVGIDAPFGWPRAFVLALTGYASGNRWTEFLFEGKNDNEPLHPALRLRLTDLATRELTSARGDKIDPLSVSTQLIAGCAMRAAQLLSHLANPAASSDWQFDRTGLKPNGKRVLEVYPGASLTCWGFDRRGYKGRKLDHREKRAELVVQLRRELEPKGLHFGSQVDPDLLVDTDHAFDAFLATLTAAVAAQPGGTVAPQGLDSTTIESEGWTHLPTGDLGDINFAVASAPGA